MEHIQADMSEIKADLKSLTNIVIKLPTKDNLITYWFASLDVGFAVMGTVIGGIIGGLSWIQHR